MQRYKNIEENAILLVEFLDFLKFKASNGLLTKQELDSLYKVLVESSKISATIGDLSSFYHQSPNNVKVLINRKMLSRPQRKVLYSFNEFAKIKPDGWD